MDAQSFLERSTPIPRLPVYVLFGDELFLRRQAREAIVAAVLGDSDPSLALTVLAGDSLEFSTIRNDLDTPPFLSPCRLVIVENADGFITENRTELEDYVRQPSAVNVLILDAKTFADNTRIAKLIPPDAKIACKTLAAQKLGSWCTAWARTKYRKKLARDAAELLVELVGTSLGLLDQELAKLAVATGDKTAVTADDVQRLVGRSSSANVFSILDAIGDGRPTDALSILEHLFADGEDSMAILAPLSYQLRKLASVGRGLASGLSINAAMDAAGVMAPGHRFGCEKQVRHLGLRRLAQLNSWLVELNLGVKGWNPLPPRIQVERLVVKLARPREGEKKPTAK